MNKKVDRKLLAYVQFDEMDHVVIDVIETSKNGLSYHYKNTTWNRDIRFFGNDFCTDPHGNKCKIVTLRRWHTPSWVENADIHITDEARERYQLWIAKKLRSSRNE